ncbi:MAG: glycosyltransferase family 2 protein [Candidatus Micrarchaeota archaeon]|nr:glycosyltransferase family 2 protein [Candidatus Micrarchaeota archaeon]
MQFTPAEIVYIVISLFGLYFAFLFLLIFSREKSRFSRYIEPKKFPSVSIIVPAYNEEDSVVKTLQNLKRLEYPGEIEIILVDDGSTDATPKLAKTVPGVKVYTKPRGGKASALNFGLKKAKGRIIGVVDADSYPRRDSLVKAIGFFQDRNVAAVTTTILVRNARTFMERMQKIEYILIAWTRRLLDSFNSIYATPGPLTLYRKDVLLKVGGFDEKNLTEDIEIAWRLLSKGYRIKMSIPSVTYTKPPKTFSGWWRQRLRWNIGGMQTFFKYARMFFNRNVLGMFLLPFFSISYVLSLIGVSLMGYIIFKTLTFTLPSLIGSLSAGAQPKLDFLILPSFTLLLSVIIGVTVLLELFINFTSIRYQKVRIRDLVPYVLIYITIFPFNLLHSTWRFVRRKYTW